MHAIVDSVGWVSGMIGGIAGDADTQARSMAEAVRAVSSVDQLTQANAELVGESVTSYKAVMQQADVVNELVSSFKL